MRRPKSSSAAYRDESIGAKWSAMKEYDAVATVPPPLPSSTNGTVGSPAMHAANNANSSGAGSPRLNLSTREKFIQFRKQSSLRLANMRNQLSGKYRRAGEDEPRSEVSTTPSGETEHDVSGSVNCTSMRSFGAVGRGIRTSKSLQNLEQITKDSWRQMADKTTYLGQNLKHRYSSKVDINKLAPKMNYKELEGDESDEEYLPTDRLF